MWVVRAVMSGTIRTRCTEHMYLRLRLKFVRIGLDNDLVLHKLGEVGQGRFLTQR